MKISPISLLSASVLLSAHAVLGGDAEPIISLLEKDEASPTAKLSLRGGGGGGRELEYEPRLYYKGTTEDVINNGDRFGLCQGDCDVDSDCHPGFRCFQRDGFDHVFGCTGGGSGDKFDVDYCVWSDAKSDCPNGEEGYYCGNNEDVPSQGPHSDGDPSTIHLGDNVLYECERRYENGQWVAYWDKIDTCTNNDQHIVCQVNGGGHDQCVKPSESHPVCPNGRDGRYCGNNPYAPSQGPSKEYGALHLDDGVLYECNSGFWHKIDTCTNNHPYEICYVHGGGHDDCIEPHPAPGPPPPAPHPPPGPSPECPGNVNGQYCGNSPLVAHVTHLENGVLYNCDDGHYSYSLDCEDLVHKDYPPYFCHYTTDTHKYGTDTCKLMLPPVPPSPTAAPTAGPTTFCENSANKNECVATDDPDYTGPPYPECVGTDGRGGRCKKGDNTAKCFEATKKLLNTQNGSMETIMNHAKLFKYGVYCGDFNGCNKSEQCCAPPAPCDDKDDNGVDESCKEQKDCQAYADGDYFELLRCEASFVQDLQHAYIESLKNGKPQLNGFCDKKWYTEEFDITLHQGTMTTTGAKFFTSESVLNAFSPCCSPYGVPQCLGNGGSKVDECTDDVLCFCKSIADKFAYLEGDYKTCSNSYKHIDDKCSNVHPDDVPFDLHYTSYSH